MSLESTITSLTVDLDIQLLSDRATLPTHGSALAAGLDLYSAGEKVVPAKGKILVDLQISIAVPVGHYGRVAPRSGLASKHGIQTGAGVIDSDYRGPVMILLFNHSDVDFSVKQGDRIAQLILERISIPRLRQVESLDSTARGAGGFGSTGGFGDHAAKKLKVENGDAVVTVESDTNAEVEITTNGNKAYMMDLHSQHTPPSAPLDHRHHANVRENN